MPSPPETAPLSGLRAIVTGAARGIGAATVAALQGQGARVAGLDRSDPPGRRGDGADHWCRGDSGDARVVDHLADEVVERWGGIDLWVNNAAKLLVKPFLDTSPADWDDVLATNLVGYVNGCRASARHMLPAGSGSIVNISSVVSEQPPAGLAAYATAKGGVDSLTRALAVELGQYGVTVNAIAPGAIETPLNEKAWDEEVRRAYRARIPLRRIALAQEVADVVALLASPAASYVTGQVLKVDGGLTLDGTVGHAGADR